MRKYNKYLLCEKQPQRSLKEDMNVLEGKGRTSCPPLVLLMCQCHSLAFYGAKKTEQEKTVFTEQHIFPAGNFYFP